VRGEARIHWAQMQVLVAFLFVAVVYGLALGPLSIALNDPIHAHPLSAFGKALMARVGFVQPIAAAFGLIAVGVSALTTGRMRQTASWVALVLNAYVVGYLVIELLMVVTWPFILWHYSQVGVGNMASAHETTLWPMDWHVQLIVGLAAMSLGTVAAVLGLRRALRTSVRRAQIR